MRAVGVADACAATRSVAVAASVAIVRSRLMRLTVERFVLRRCKTRRVILAIDQGTTGTTCLLVDDELNVRARGYAELPQHFPQPGFVEHDPEEIWQSVLAAAEQALAGGEASAIGITNQRETTIVWDRRTGVPVHNAIVWQDRRTAERCAELPRELIR